MNHYLKTNQLNNSTELVLIKYYQAFEYVTIKQIGCCIDTKMIQYERSSYIVDLGPQRAHQHTKVPQIRLDE